MRAILLFVIGAALSSCASGGALPPQGAQASRIAVGMQRLGASQTRSACYADRIAVELEPSEEEEAAEIVERSRDREEMKNGVLSASAPVKRAFIGANLRCKYGL